MTLKKELAVKEIVDALEAIPRKDSKKPKVAIFGDLYVRDNDVFNKNLLRFLEDNGAEVITTPYSQYHKMIADAYFKRWFREFRFDKLLCYRTLLAAVEVLEKSYEKYFNRLLPLAKEKYEGKAEDILSQFGVRIEQGGESLDNVLKVWYLKQHYPDISLFVQTSPGFCCAGLITEAMNKRIEEVTKVPVVSLTYDGIGSDPNEILVPYLRFPRINENGSEAESEAG